MFCLLSSVIIDQSWRKLSKSKLLIAFSLCLGSLSPSPAYAAYWYTTLDSVTVRCADAFSCAIKQMEYYYGTPEYGIKGCEFRYTQLEGWLVTAWCDGIYTPMGTTRGGGATLACEGAEKRSGTGCYIPLEKDNLCVARVGNPVDARLGVKHETAVDYSVGGEPALALQRSYWSELRYEAGKGANASRLGNAWRTNFDAVLTFLSGSGTGTPSRVVAVLPDAREVIFEWNSSTSAYRAVAYHPIYDYIGPAPNVTERLAKVGATWELSTLEDVAYVFDTDGRLTTIRHRGGYTQTLTWSTAGKNTEVNDNLGRALTFSYGPYGLLSEVTVPGGDKIKYSYFDKSTPGEYDIPSTPHTEYVLASITYPDTTPATDSDNPKVQYHYEHATLRYLLTGKTDERGIRIATWTYNAEGKVTQAERAGGLDRYTFAHDTANGKTTVTNPLNKQTVYHYNRFVFGTSRLTRIQGVASANCAAADTLYGYDANGFLNQETDGEGRKTTYVRDSRGRPTSITRGAP
jgi:YD repeat-containing protein